MRARWHLVEIPSRNGSCNIRSVGSKKEDSEDSCAANIRRTMYRANDEGGWDRETDEGAVRMVRNTGLNIYPRQTENSDVAVSCERFRKIWCEREENSPTIYEGRRNVHGCSWPFALVQPRNCFPVCNAMFSTDWHGHPSHCFLSVEMKSAFLFQTTVITATL